MHGGLHPFIEVQRDLPAGHPGPEGQPLQKVPLGGEQGQFSAKALLPVNCPTVRAATKAAVPFIAFVRTPRRVILRAVSSAIMLKFSSRFLNKSTTPFFLLLFRICRFWEISNYFFTLISYYA